MPTAPTGDIVWAASPSSSRPGRYQRRQAARLHGQERGLGPVAQRPRPAGQPRHPQPHRAAQRLEPLRPQAGVAALGQRVADLPLGAAVQQRGRAAVADVDPGGGIRLLPGEPEPEEVDRRRGAHRLQPGQAPQPGEAPVGPHHQLRPDLVPPVPGPVAHPADVPVVVLHQGLDAGARDQPEGGAAPGLLDDQVEEAHLGHDGHERVRGPEAADVVERHRLETACGSGRPATAPARPRAGGRPGPSARAGRAPPAAGRRRGSPGRSRRGPRAARRRRPAGPAAGPAPRRPARRRRRSSRRARRRGRGRRPAGAGGGSVRSLIRVLPGTVVVSSLGARWRSAIQGNRQMPPAFPAARRDLALPGSL